MTDTELKELVASLVVAQKEFINEISAIFKKVAVAVAQKDLTIAQKERDEQIAKTDRQIEETQKILDKFGAPPEVLAIPSIYKMLFEQFNLSTISKYFSRKVNDEVLEIDVFGYEDSTLNTAVAVKINTYLDDDAIERIEEIMKNFSIFFPDHADKKLYGVIACVHAPESFQNVLRKKGIYLAILHEGLYEDVFKLQEFKNFTPTDFSQKRA